VIRTCLGFGRILILEFIWWYLRFFNVLFVNPFFLLINIISILIIIRKLILFIFHPFFEPTLIFVFLFFVIYTVIFRILILTFFWGLFWINWITVFITLRIFILFLFFFLLLNPYVVYNLGLFIFEWSVVLRLFRIAIIIATIFWFFTAASFFKFFIFP
jgi:hypothetical protein